jgi:hypothetical protein
MSATPKRARLDVLQSEPLTHICTLDAQQNLLEFLVWVVVLVLVTVSDRINRVLLTLHWLDG